VTLDIAELTQAQAEEIAGWRYEPPYDFYDAIADAGDLAELMSPESRADRYFGAFDGDGLAGFFAFAPANGVVTVGLGLRPDLTGRGLGLRFLEEGLAFAMSRFAPNRFRLAVAAFNERAITVYERAGFAPTRTYEHETNGGVHTFVELERQA
jgi:[ribosomal protein S18]-alanine N-acetyltransferase